MLNFRLMTDQKKTDLDQASAANADTQAGTDNQPDVMVDDQVDQSAGEGAQDAPQPGSVESELEAAQIEVANLKDAFLRAKAEEDNVRRRAEKEVSNSRKFAVEGFAKEMLNVYDSLKLAVAVELADDADDAIKSVHEGVNITLKQLQAGFSKFSISEIVPNVGDKLDPNLHQAMSLVESADVASGCILNVIQSGFQLHERLLRPAMVVVAK